MSGMPEFGDWRALPGPGGATLAVAGDYIAAATLNSVSVWREGELLATANATAATPGRPRFVPAGDRPERVCWGTVSIDLAAGSRKGLDGLAGAVVPAAVPRIPDRGSASTPVATDFAWSADGSVVLVSRQETGAPQAISASATLYQPSGQPAARLWHESAAGPVAGLVTPHWAIVGSRRPSVFALGGDPLAVLDGATPPRRIETDLTAARVLTVESPALRLWETDSWTQVGTADGPWSDASVTPDGLLVLAIDFDGRLQVLDDALKPVSAVGSTAPGWLDGVAVGTSAVAVASAGRVYWSCRR